MSDQQLSIETLREHMSRAIANRSAPAPPPASAPAPVQEEIPAALAPKKVWATENQRGLIRRMIFERFLPLEAEKMWQTIDWTEVNYKQFQVMLQELRAIRRLPVEVRQQALPATERVSLPQDLAHGTYTVQYPDGTYKVIRIRIQPTDDEFMPGVALIAYQNGPNNKLDFRSFANVRKDGSVAFWRRWTKMDLEKAFQAILGAVDGVYTTAEGEKVEVTKSDRCAKCGDVLTAPTTKNPYREMGYGPKCGPSVGLKM